MDKSTFTDVDSAMEEAVWLADTYKVPHVMAWEDGRYTVFPKDQIQDEVALEVFNPLAPAVRCRNCGYIDERGADISIIQGP
jgi:hypothetical protein